MEPKKYWKGLEERNPSAEFQKSVEKEFREELPFVEPEGLLSAATPRRDFLKYLGFSVTAATLAASCEIQVRKAIPYLNKPEEITPGVPNYYASTFALDGDYCAVVIKDRDGRPIKMEGNKLSSITQGGTSARVQGAVLSLYDTARLRFPSIQDKETTWEELDKQVMQTLSGLGNAPVVLLTTSIISPSINQAIGEFLQKYPGSRHVTYDAVSYSGLLLANESCYGKRAIPVYHFENARCIVSLGADFLGTWLSPVEFAGQYAKNRKIDPLQPAMNQHFQFESQVSLTGANADYRFTHQPSDTPAVTMSLYNVVATALGQPLISGVPAIADAHLAKGIQQAGKALAAHPGASLVVSGSNNQFVQVIVNGINELLGAGGKTIDWSATLNYRQGIDGDMIKLVDDMEAGQVGALLVFSANPAYDYYDAQKFSQGLQKVKLSLSFNERKDETTVLCQYAAPDSHFLESWGDAEPRSGYYSLQQPGIAPLFKTRAFLESLLKWSGAANSDPLSYIQAYFKNNIYSKYGNGSEYQTFWDQSLQNGVIEPLTPPALTGLPFTGKISAAATQLISSPPVAGQLEVVLYEKVAIGSGRWANNPWLQEMPDPISKVTWDNYACISPSLAEKMGVNLTRFNEVDFHRPVGKLTINGRDLLLPLLPTPGLHENVIAIAVGYGRSKNIGKAGGEIGKNVYPLVSYNASTQGFDYFSTQVSLAKTSDKYLLAITQSHNSFEGRPIIKETTLQEFIQDPKKVNEDRKDLKKYGPDFRTDATLYPDIHHYPGIKWGMSIDLNSCIGCGACTIACTAENNVSVVGKAEVARGHEMQWLRIDRYFSGDPANPQVVFQPMLCQQCDNAPCENVCPVAATSHSSEGLNQMVYNRCIGTRYCENNCPFKVRRFNWRDWNGADSFADNLFDDPIVQTMNEDLTRMVLNPDVTVRSRGVMEKCTFCVQRLQSAKLKAKKKGHPLQDGEAVTACQQACPTRAIDFGNVNDHESEVYLIRNEKQTDRHYYALEELHVLPSISYLAKIVNKDPEDFFSEGPQHYL
ncbi:MAG: TAT-variant-translocated molybdopterin oxidoreductase [Chitinophagaceae bacterium]